MCSSLTVDPRNWYWAEGHCRSPEQALAGARREDRGNIDAPRTVRTQPDDGPLARLERKFALAVDGDDAGPRVDRKKHSRAHPLDIPHTHRHDQPGCDGGDDPCFRFGRDVGGDPIWLVPGDRRQLAQDAGQADHVRFRERAEELG
jgi:hypothetical protein